MKKFILLALAVCAVLPAYAQDKKNTYSIAYESSSYIYREPYMDNPISSRGRMSGVVFDYVGRSAFTAKDIDANDPSFLALQLRYMSGKVNYSGWSYNTLTGVTSAQYTSDISDYYLEGRLTAGGVYELGSALELWPYLGIAGRYLVDKGYEKSSSAYRRTSAYLYAPAGLTAKIKLPAKWTIALNGEYDIFISGTQKSRLSDAISTYPDISNKQGQGFGARTSLKIEKEFKQIGLFIEPFYRYWHIQNSDWVDGNQEPQNLTYESGLKIGITF